MVNSYLHRKVALRETLPPAPPARADDTQHPGRHLHRPLPHVGRGLVPIVARVYQGLPPGVLLKGVGQQQVSEPSGNRTLWLGLPIKGRTLQASTDGLAQHGL